MKKFTISTNDEKIKKQKNIDEKIKDVIDENLKILHKNNKDEKLNENLSVVGHDEFIKEYLLLNEKYSKITKENMKEWIKYNMRFVNEEEIEKQIKILENQKHQLESITPQKYFSDVDYDKVSDNIIMLKSLDVIPEEIDLNQSEIERFFENGNVLIEDKNGVWELTFNCERLEEFATSIDSEDEKYTNFIRKNKLFVINLLQSLNNITNISVKKLGNIL